MRSSFFISLLITAIIGSTYWYQSRAAFCPVPILYQLGQLHDGFSLTEDEARNYLLKAEAAWEAPFNRDLFVYDETAPLVVDFVFDERQALADSEFLARRALDEKKTANEEIFEDIEELTAEYNNLAEEYESATNDYEIKLNTYNQEVQRYNDQGGAPAAVFENLERTRLALNEEAEVLQARSEELNELAKNLNELSERGNTLVEQYNQEVNRYNSNFGFSREFTQGDFQGDRINIYKFSDEAELVTVLAHEFGHALGIGHVEGESSIMYYLLEETSINPVPSPQDKEAFLAVCGTGEEFTATLFNQLRKILQIFN